MKEHVNGSPLQFERDVDHGLSQLVLTVDVLHAVGLIDDVDQVMGFGLAPEDLPGTCKQCPAILQEQGARLAHVEVRSASIVRIDPQEGRQSQEPVTRLAFP